MRIEVPAISSAEELENVEPFRVEHLLWGTTQIPETYGYLGFVPSDGFYLKMVCREKNPLHLDVGSSFWCNFYKISEAAEIEHYASYAPIRTEIPSFHLPEFFATADIVEA